MSPLLRRALRLVPLLALIAASGLVTTTALADGEGADKPAASTPEATLAKAFEAALADDFDAYLRAIHPFHKRTDEDREGLEKYSWRRFVRQAEWYVDGSDAKSFEVTRQDGEDEERRLFIKDKTHEDRMPVPVRFARKDGVWYITANSL